MIIALEVLLTVLYYVASAVLFLGLMLLLLYIGVKILSMLCGKGD